MQSPLRFQDRSLGLASQAVIFGSLPLPVAYALQHAVISVASSPPTQAPACRGSSGWAGSLPHQDKCSARQETAGRNVFWFFFRNNSMLPRKPWLSATALLFLMPPNFHKRSLRCSSFCFSAPFPGVSAEAPKSVVKRGAAPAQPEPGLKHSSVLVSQLKFNHLKRGTHLKAANPEVSAPFVGDTERSREVKLPQRNCAQKLVPARPQKGTAGHPAFKHEEEK